MSTWRRSAGWLQAAALILAGLAIVLGAARPWAQSDLSRLWLPLQDGLGGRAGLEFGEGQITFALGFLAIALGSLRALRPSGAVKLLVSVLGFAAAGVVMGLACVKLTATVSLPEEIVLLSGSVQAGAGVGLHWTLAGACLAALGSLLGLVPGDPHQPTLWEETTQRWPSLRPVRWAAWAQAAALVVGGLLLVAGALSPWLGHGSRTTVGLELDEGRITLALGLLAIALGGLRGVSRSDGAKLAVSVLGFSLSAAVTALASAELLDIQPGQSVGVGIAWAIAGGCVGGLGSLLGIAPSHAEESTLWKEASRRWLSLPGVPHRTSTG